MNFKNHWYKILGVLLFIYVLIAGMLVPLKPGISHITPFVVAAGQQTKINIHGYNSNYESGAATPKVWLKLVDDKGVAASRVEVVSYNELEVNFTVPSIDKNVTRAVIYVDNQLDGTSILPNVQVRHPEMTVEQVRALPNIALIDIPYHELSTKAGWQYPYREILHETVRYTFFHIAIWMAMFVLMMVAVYHSIQVLRKQDIIQDIKAASFSSVSILFGLMGILTGSIWAKFTWGAFWTSDVKLNMTAVALLIYTAYVVLRASIQDKDQRARISAVYNIFAFLMLIPLIFVIPRLNEMESLHPGNGGNPALGGEDLDHSLRMVFYPAIIAFLLLGIWMSNLRTRIHLLAEKALEKY